MVIMEKKKIILAALIIISLFVWLPGLRVHPLGRPALPAGRSGNKLEKNSQALNLADSLERPRKRTAYKGWGRDPFTISRVSAPAAPGLQLGGIVYDIKDSYALINDEVLHTGDEVSGNKVIEIKQDRVILNDGIKDFELKLEQ